MLPAREARPTFTHRAPTVERYPVAPRLRASVMWCPAPFAPSADR
jgi:hypothetical protein